MMKQEILKIHHDNVRMMKELPETKLLLPLSSTPPVDDILCKSTHVAILSAPSLPSPDTENEKSKEKGMMVRKTYTHSHLLCHFANCCF